MLSHFPHLPAWVFSRLPTPADNLPLYGLALLYLELGRQFWRFVREPVGGWTRAERLSMLSAGVRVERGSSGAVAALWTAGPVWDCPTLDLEDRTVPQVEIYHLARGWAHGRALRVRDVEAGRILNLFRTAGRLYAIQLRGLIDAPSHLHP